MEIHSMADDGRDERLLVARMEEAENTISKFPNLSLADQKRLRDRCHYRSSGPWISLTDKEVKDLLEDIVNRLNIIEQKLDMQPGRVVQVADIRGGLGKKNA